MRDSVWSRRLRSESLDLVLLVGLEVALAIRNLSRRSSGNASAKALRVNLSDLAAKGASPFGYLLGLALPADWTEAWLARFAKALGEDQRRYGITLLGGDTTRAADGLTIAITALGRVPRGKMVLRSGAKVGDAIFVSGTIGDAALGLRIRQGSLRVGGKGAKYLRDRSLHPEPRVALATAVQRHASAAMDVSDGLVGDLSHICTASGVGAEIVAEAVPLSSAARSVLDANPSLLSVVLNGGEDFEILATVPGKSIAAFERAARAARVPVARIGTIGRGAAPVVRDRTGNVISVAVAAHTHF